MRHIDIKKARNVELWPGRRLFVEEDDGTSLFTLPRSAMSQYGTTLSFGTLAGVTCQVHGTKEAIARLTEAIISNERSVLGKVTIK